jgi:acyl carrier protein
MLSETVVVEIVSQLLDIEDDTLSADRPLADIDGWDSVNALRVLVSLERRLGRPIDYQRFTQAERLADLWSPALTQPMPAVAP